MPNPTGLMLAEVGEQFSIVFDLCRALGPDVQESPYWRAMTTSEEEEATRLENRISTTLDSFDDVVRRNNLEYEFSEEILEVCDPSHAYLDATVERAVSNLLIRREAKALLGARQAGRMFVDKLR